MFSKSADTTPPPAPAASPRASGNSNRSVLAADLRITGEISSTGTIEVLGEIEGNITSKGLIIGAEGRVSGTVSAENVEVRGKLDGSVATHGFALRASAEVQADVLYTTLMIENGASIEGKFAVNKA